MHGGNSGSQQSACCISSFEREEKLLTDFGEIGVFSGQCSVVSCEVALENTVDQTATDEPAHLHPQPIPRLHVSQASWQEHTNVKWKPKANTCKPKENCITEAGGVEIEEIVTETSSDIAGLSCPMAYL